EFDLEIKDRKGSENSMADHLSQLVRDEEPLPISDSFPDEHLFSVQGEEPWYADLVNFVVAGGPRHIRGVHRLFEKININNSHGLHVTNCGFSRFLAPLLRDIIPVVAVWWPAIPLCHLFFNSLSFVLPYWQRSSLACWDTWASAMAFVFEGDVDGQMECPQNNMIMIPLLVSNAR
ncbi:hypothetical protein CRG98_026094, partial [Punica granatum]